MSNSRISDETLLAYAAGDLEGAEARDVEAHLAANPAAARLVAMYRLAAETTANDESVAPPAEAVDRAKAIFRAAAAHTRPGAPGWLARLEAVVASLVFDSRLQALAVRSGGMCSRFMLSFEADGAEIDLQAERIVPAAGEDVPRWRVIGQVSGDEDPGIIDVAAVAAEGDDVCATARSDERSIFTLDVEAGTYDIRLRSRRGTLVLPGVAIP